ncbi:MAG: DUF5711 family protein [Lachnospiraceae bacterium]|nr:DUF5711 family protein [Lachnospiraceae bacterium]
MASIRNFAARSASEPSYLEKIRSHKLAILYRTALVIVLIAAGVALAYFSWRDKVFHEADVVKEAAISEAETAEFLAFGEQVVQYSKDGIRCINADGEVLWNQTYEMQAPIIRTCKNIVAVGDYNGNLIYVAGATGPIGTIDTNLPIRGFCVASQGVVAVILDDRDDAWIYLYDAQGTTLAYFKTTMADSGYPLAVSISPSGELVGVSFLYAKDGKIRSSIAFYNFGSVGQNAIDNYVSGYDYTGVVAPFVQFLGDSSVCAVSNDRIMFYAGAQIPTSRAEHLMGGEEITGVYARDNHVALLFHNSTEKGAYRLLIYNDGGDLLTTLYFDQEFEDVLMTSDRVIIYSAEAWLIYDLNGNEKYAGAFSQPVRMMVPTAVRNRFLAVTNSSIQTLELR